ncbi:MAG: peptidylprolyl isomerase [Bacteroidaceae bacterium]
MMRYLLYLLLILIPLQMDAKKKDTRQRVALETNKGTIVVALSDLTPLHRDNFIKLTQEGFFDGLLFHRVIEDFMIQGGDPDSKEAPTNKRLGEGGPNYTLPAEIHVPELYHHRGALAAAREGDDVNPERRSSGSQFYIVWGKTFSQRTIAEAQAQLDQMTAGEIRLTPDQCVDYETRGGTPHLDGQYTVFGEVVEGLHLIKAIQKVKTDRNDRPIEDVKIRKASLVKIK